MGGEPKYPRHYCLSCGHPWWPKSDRPPRCPECGEERWFGTDLDEVRARKARYTAQQASEAAHRRSVQRATNLGCLTAIIGAAIYFWSNQDQGGRAPINKPHAPSAPVPEKTDSSPRPTSVDLPTASPEELGAIAALAEAEAFVAGRQYAEALAAFERTAADYPATRAGAKAKDRAAAMRGDEKIMSAVRAAEQEQLAKQQEDRARQLWEIAENYDKNRMPAKARATLEELIERFAGTEYAKKARERLEELDR